MWCHWLFGIVKPGDIFAILPIQNPYVLLPLLVVPNAHPPVVDAPVVPVLPNTFVCVVLDVVFNQNSNSKSPIPKLNLGIVVKVILDATVCNANEDNPNFLVVFDKLAPLNDAHALPSWSTIVVEAAGPLNCIHEFTYISSSDVKFI